MCPFTVADAETAVGYPRKLQRMICYLQSRQDGTAAELLCTAPSAQRHGTRETAAAWLVISTQLLRLQVRWCAVWKREKHRRTGMGTVIDIQLHLRSCENCHWSNGSGICQRPGGWWFDSKFRYCATFERAQKVRKMNQPPGEPGGWRSPC